MRDWIVEGIDHKTGNARRLRINAQDEKQASSIAYTMGVTAQRVYVAGAPEPEASAMEQLGLAAHDRAASRPPARSSPAKNREFSSAGRRLRAADTILSAIGWIYVVLAVVALFLAIVTLLNSTPGH